MVLIQASCNPSGWRRSLSGGREWSRSGTSGDLLVPLPRLLGDDLVVLLLRRRLAGELLGLGLAGRADLAEVDREALARERDAPELVRRALAELEPPPAAGGGGRGRRGRRGGLRGGLRR